MSPTVDKMRTKVKIFGLRRGTGSHREMGMGGKDCYYRVVMNLKRRMAKERNERMFVKEEKERGKRPSYSSFLT